mgnify:CR=1 FL=1
MVKIREINGGIYFLIDYKSTYPDSEKPLFFVVKGKVYSIDRVTNHLSVSKVDPVLAEAL